MPPLPESEIKSRVQSVPEWRIESGELVRSIECKDFRTALDLVNRIGEMAESAGHHPDIDIRYNKVRLSLITHDQGGLTAKDFELAAQIDKTV